MNVLAKIVLQGQRANDDNAMLIVVQLSNLMLKVVECTVVYLLTLHFFNRYKLFYCKTKCWMFVITHIIQLIFLLVL